MGIFYHFLSTLEGVNSSKPLVAQISHHPWLKTTTWLPPAERELEYFRQSMIFQRSFFVGALKCALHREVWIFIGRSYKEYNNRDDGDDGTDIAASSEVPSSLWKPWNWPLHKKLRDSILPFMTRHLATLWTMEFYRFLASLFCSKLVLLKLSQHPYYKVEYLALKDHSPLSVASRAFVVTVWSSALYYLADLTVRQVSIGFAEYNWSAAIMDPETKEKYIESSWAKSSWELLYRQYLRFWYSSLGSAMGSMVWPGFGTLAGIGLGEEWADEQDIPSPPGLLWKAFPQLEKYFASSTKATTQPKQSSTILLQARELLCGCCQAKYFSSNPNHPTHAPISSKSCEHTICRSCVDLCHVAELKQSGASDVAFSEQLAGCPICDLPAAFSPQELLVNQSLCHVISLLERSQNCSSEEQDQTSPVEIDMGKVKKHKRLSWLASLSDDDDNSPSQFPSSSDMSSDDDDALDDDDGEGGVVDEDYAPSRVASANSMFDDGAVVNDDDDDDDDDENDDMKEGVLTDDEQDESLEDTLAV